MIDVFGQPCSLLFLLVGSLLVSNAPVVGTMRPIVRARVGRAACNLSIVCCYFAKSVFAHYSSMSSW